MDLTAGSAWRFAAPVALMAAIFIFSAQPFEGDPLAWWEVLARKLGHVTGYFLLTGAWLWALAGRARHPLPLAIAISFLYAISDELHQTTVEGRTGTLVDVGIDTIGIAIAATAWLTLESRRAAKTKPGQDAGRAPKRAHRIGA